MCTVESRRLGRAVEKAVRCHRATGVSKADAEDCVQDAVVALLAQAHDEQAQINSVEAWWWWSRGAG